MKTLNVPARIEYLEEILTMVDEFLHPADVPDEISMKIRISVEEIFTNIVSYAYGPDGGEIEISCGQSTDHSADHKTVLQIQIKDRGIPYNPLDYPTPELAVPLEERRTGGLGIYMARQFMDNMEYHYENDCNILTMYKELPGSQTGEELS